jgi:hypothetical protein
MLSSPDRSVVEVRAAVADAADSTGAVFAVGMIMAATFGIMIAAFAMHL